VASKSKILWDLTAIEIKPDFALIDIKLKTDNGIDITKKITDNLDTALIYITGHFNGELMQLMLAAKPYEYTVKPFEENQLKCTIENTLYRRRIYQRIILSK